MQTLQNNVLSCFVLLPTDQATSIDNNGFQHLQEKFKGPYYYGKDTKFLINTDTPESVRVKLRANGALNPVAQKIAPALPRSGYRFVLQSVQIDEIDAGDHCIIRCEYVEATVQDQSSSYAKSEKQITWSCQWQSYSMPVAEYCKNDQNVPAYISPNADGSYNIPSKQNLPAGTAYWPRIEKLMNASDENLKSQLAFKEGDQCYVLTQGDYKIYEKVILGRQPTFHYPVLTQTITQSYLPTSADTTSYLSAAYEQEVGQNIDHEVNLSGYACPYDFPAEWRWLKIGDQLEQTKTKNANTYKHSIQFMGMKDFDQNFYGEGNDRWEINSI